MCSPRSIPLLPAPPQPGRGRPVWQQRRLAARFSGARAFGELMNRLLRSRHAAPWLPRSFSIRDVSQAQGVAASSHLTHAESPPAQGPSKGPPGTHSTVRLLWLLVQERVHGPGRDQSAWQLERREQRPGSQNHLGEVLRAAPRSAGGCPAPGGGEGGNAWRAPVGAWAHLGPPGKDAEDELGHGVPSLPPQF